MSALPARASIEYTCRLLRSYGIYLTAETLRQAKFDSASAYQPLLQALHDLACCTAAGFPGGCEEGLRQLKQQLQQETVDGATIPPEGMALTQHLLLTWGCPAALVVQLGLPHNSSRTCLLALAWLVGYAKLFDRALEHLQIPEQLLQFMPPYPEDTSTTAACQQQYRAAVAAAQRHSQKVLQHIQQQQQPKESSGDGTCWRQVQAAAHHLLSTYRATGMRLQLLTSLLEGREKLLHDIQQQQQLTDADAVHSTGSSTSSSRRTPAAVLTAFELHLLANPPLLQQYQEGLQKCCSLLQQQLQCVQAANTFFAWAESVIDEDIKQLGPVGASSGTRSAHEKHSQSSQSQQQQRQQRQQQQQQQQRREMLLSVPSVAELLPLVQQLPAAGSKVAASVLQKILKQLQQAAAEQGFDLDNNMSSSSAEPVAAYQKAAAAAAVSAASFGQDLPQELLELPADIQQLLDSVKQQRLQQQVARQDAEAAVMSSKQQPWLRQQVSAEQLKLLSDQINAAQQQGQQQREREQPSDGGRNYATAAVCMERLSLGSGLADCASVDGIMKPSLKSAATAGALAATENNTSITPAGPGQVACVSVLTELQRLSTLSLCVAKQLAKTRVANKQQLQTAADLLLGGEESCNV